MSLLRLTPRRRRLAAATLSVFAFAAAHAVEAPSKPDATETLFWQSTERLASPDAYRAYLAAYPHGFFAALANATLASDKGVAPGATPGRTQKPAATASAASLKPFREDADSNAVSFDLGQASDGPVALTVGRLGARRQIVLPPGHWVALAAVDDAANLSSAFAATTVPVRVKIGTATFGRFSDERLTSLMRFSFTAEKTAPVAWSSFEACDKVPATVIRVAPPASSGWRDECAALGSHGGPLGDGSAASAQTLKSLARLGATVHGPALVATLSLNDRQRGFLRATRYEWAPGESPAGAADAERYWGWFQGYRQAALLGYTNDFEGELGDFPAP